MPNTREKLIELLKTIPQVNHAQASVEGIDYVFGCAADHLIANGATIPVRCKDCYWWNNHRKGIGAECACNRFSSPNYYENFTQPNDFCSYGERKDGK